MTPNEERARALSHCSDPGNGCALPSTIRHDCERQGCWQRAAITAALDAKERERDAAVAAERERCAKVADGVRETGDKFAQRAKGALSRAVEDGDIDRTIRLATEAKIFNAYAECADDIAKAIRSLLSTMPAERVEIAGSGEADGREHSEFPG